MASRKYTCSKSGCLKTTYKSSRYCREHTAAADKRRKKTTQTPAHDWDYSRKDQSIAEQMRGCGYRKCRNCGKEQWKEAQYSWMRVTGYKWLPLAGRCKGKQED